MSFTLIGLNLKYVDFVNFNPVVWWISLNYDIELL